MAEISPFRGLLYNSDALGSDIRDFVAPPYDVISPEMRDELYLRSDFNIARLILGKELPDDGPEDNRYKRAGRFLEKWISEQVLVTDAEPSFYVYLQEYEIGSGQKRDLARRIGFIGLMDLKGPDQVLPHEHTLSRPKEDRMNLMREVESNLSPIFGLYQGEGTDIPKILEKTVSSSSPLIDINFEGVRNALWKISDEDSINDIRASMKGKKVFIADGHHRYSVAESYRRMCCNETDYDGRADNLMIYLADMSDPKNLTVMGTHRVLSKVGELTSSEIKARLQVHFRITRVESVDDLLYKMDEKNKESYVYGYFDGKEFNLLEPLEKDRLKGLIEDKPLCWKGLDVSVLHSAVMEKILGVKPEEGNIAYVKEPAQGIGLVSEGKGKVVFFLNPTKIEQLRAVAESGEMMPQKSTYFYPKLLSGMVINRFEDQKEKVK